MTPDLPPIPPGAWLPRLEAARRLGVTERTLQRRMRDGRVMTRQVSGNRVQVYVQETPGAPTDLVRTPDMTALATALTPFLTRTAEQEAIIRQQAEEIGQLRERLCQAEANRRHVADELEAIVARRNAALAAQAAPWWRVLWARLRGEQP